MTYLGIKDYKSLSSDGKAARRAWIKTRCISCPYKNDKDLCMDFRFKICLEAFTKGFVAGVKHHRKLVKNKRK